MVWTNKLLNAALLGTLAAAPAYGFKITWTGAGDGTDLFNESNWVSAIGGLPPAAGTIDPAVAVDLLIDIGDWPLVIDASAGPLTLGAGGLLQINGATITSTSGIRRDNTVTLNDQDNVAMILASSPQRVGQVTAASLTEIDLSLVNRLTLTDGSNPLKYSTVIFSTLGNAQARLHLTNETVEAVLSEHLDKFSVGGTGVAAVLGSDPSIGEPGDNLLIVSDGATGSIIRPITTPIQPGDTDGDGDIDDADLGAAFANYTGPVGPAGGKTHPEGDAELDGDIDDADLGLMFGSYTGPLAPAVPEPAALMVLMGAGSVLLMRRS